MVKRTRRDLSDPRIKKIIQSQIGKSYKFNEPHPSVKDIPPSRLKYFVFIVVLCAVFGGVTWSITNWTEIKEFYNSSITKKSLPQNIGNSKPDEAIYISGENQSTSLNSEQPKDAHPEIAPEQEVSKKVKKFQPVARRIQIEILNGCGVKGLAEEFTNYLREANIDVVSRGNYTHFEVEKTTLLDRIDNPNRVNKIADILGLPQNQVQVKIDQNLQLDATIILGADYRKLKPFSN